LKHKSRWRNPAAFVICELNKNKSMLLFRYFGSHALETLQDNLFKTATVSSLNDPFELLYQLTGEMTFAKAKRNLKQRIKSDQFLASVQLHNPTV
jgi:hypothetical protein